MIDKQHKPERVLVDSVILAFVLLIVVSLATGGIVAGLSLVGYGSHDSNTVALLVGGTGIVAGFGAFFGILSFWYYRRSIRTDQPA